MNLMYPSGNGLTHPGETPLHFEVTFNPHNTSEGYVQTLYKRPYPDDGVYNPIPQDEGGTSPGQSLLNIIGKIMLHLPPMSVPAISGAIIKKGLKLYPDPNTPPVFGTSAEIFTGLSPEGNAKSMELGIPME